MEKVLPALKTEGIFEPAITSMVRLMEERKDLIVKIGETHEITRPLALEMWKMVRDMVSFHGGSLDISVKVEYASPEMVIMVATARLKIGEVEITLSEVGEAYAKEKGKDTTLARTAYTRAVKRLLEILVGEDFINQTIKRLFPQSYQKGQGQSNEPASQRQTELIEKLVKEKKINEEVIQELKAEGELPEDFMLGKALKEGTLTKEQASVILDKVFPRRRT